MSTLEEIVAATSTVADKIRALATAGYSRADIARILGKRYQHVRNVLEGDRQARGVSEGEAMTFEVDAARPDWRGGAFRLRLDSEGRLTLPRQVLEAWGLRAGSVVMGTLKGEVVELITGQTAARRAQELVRKHIPAGGPSLAEELIAERRADSGRGE